MKIERGKCGTLIVVCGTGDQIEMAVAKLQRFTRQTTGRTIAHLPNPGQLEKQIEITHWRELAPFVVRCSLDLLQHDPATAARTYELRTLIDGLQACVVLAVPFESDEHRTRSEDIDRLPIAFVETADVVITITTIAPGLFELDTLKDRHAILPVSLRFRGES